MTKQATAENPMKEGSILNTDGSNGYSLREAKIWLEERVNAEGAICPCCNQFAKIYKRTINSSMAYALILIERQFAKGQDLEPEGWLHVPTFLTRVKAGVAGRGGDWAKLVYWGILEKRVALRDDGSARVGHYKLPPLGVEFVHGKTSVPKFAHVYNGKALKLSGKDIFIQEALSKSNKFNYNELMQR